MKRSEMNAHQREAFDYICAVMSEYIGGYENVLEDFSEDSEEYKRAKNFLTLPHSELINIIYNDVMGLSAKDMKRHLRFAGKDFIIERIDRRLTKWGY